MSNEHVAARLAAHNALDDMRKAYVRLQDKLMKAEAEVRQLTELYDDLAYVCPPEKARAHIMHLEAELAEAKAENEQLKLKSQRSIRRDTKEAL